MIIVIIVVIIGNNRDRNELSPNPIIQEIRLRIGGGCSSQDYSTYINDIPVFLHKRQGRGTCAKKCIHIFLFLTNAAAKRTASLGLNKYQDGSRAMPC